MKHTLFFLSFFLLVGCGGKNLDSHPLGVLGGGADTGGGEYRDMDYGSAWFPGKRMIRYCYEVSDSFGVPRAKIADELDGAFNKWRDYLVRKNIQGYIPFSEDFVLFINHAPLASCDGSEDLKFYFGVSDARTDEARRHYTNPIAFTHRVAYDAHVGWGTGFIWFAPAGSVKVKDSQPDFFYPNWNFDNVFRMLLIHEIGHTLGVGHIPGTIMDETIANWAASKVDIDRTEIDWLYELVLCRGKLCNQEYNGRILAFEKLIGRPPVGKPRASVRVQSTQEYTLNVSDDKGTWQFPMSVAIGSVFSGSSLVFQVFRYYVTSEGREAFGVVGAAFMGEQYLGELRTATGELLRVNIARNSARSGPPLRIDFLEGIVSQPLFETIVPGFEF